MQGFFNKTGLGPRQQIEEMKKWFENQEKNIEREKESDYKEKFNKFFELYDTSLTELILQIKTEFNERGSFLYQIWNKFTIIINDLVKGVSPFLLKTCPLMSSSTVLNSWPISFPGDPTIIRLSQMQTRPQIRHSPYTT